MRRKAALPQFMFRHIYTYIYIYIYIYTHIYIYHCRVPFGVLYINNSFAMIT